MFIIMERPVERWSCAYKECKAYCCRLKRNLTYFDIQRISKITGQSAEDFSEKLETPSITPYVLKQVGGKCVFLRDDYSCALHNTEAKPILCKMYPFLLSGVIHGDEPIIKISPVSNCPGYKKGEPLSQEFLKQLARHAKMYLKELRESVKPIK